MGRGFGGDAAPFDSGQDGVVSAGEVRLGAYSWALCSDMSACDYLTLVTSLTRLQIPWHTHDTGDWEAREVCLEALRWSGANQPRSRSGTAAESWANREKPLWEIAGPQCEHTVMQAALFLLLVYNEHHLTGAAMRVILILLTELLPTGHFLLSALTS